MQVPAYLVVCDVNSLDVGHGGGIVYSLSGVFVRRIIFRSAGNCHCDIPKGRRVISSSRQLF